MDAEERRALLEAVAAGELSAEEAARRLEEADLDEELGPTETYDEPAPTEVLRDGGSKRVHVDATAGSVRVIGDPGVASVLVDGDHEVEEQGDTIVVRCSPILDFNDLSERWRDRDRDDFGFRGGTFRFGSLGLAKGKLHVTIRVNPDLPLSAHMAAGSLNVRGMRGPIDVDVDAGSARLHEVRSPLHASIRAGSLSVDGRFDHGESRIHCDMGAASIRLDRKSDVRVTASVDLGRCDVRLDDEDEPSNRRGGEWVLGDGTGSLVVHGSMSSVSVTTDP
jgi:hypothetical protein